MNTRHLDSSKAFPQFAVPLVILSVVCLIILVTSTESGSVYVNNGLQEESGTIYEYSVHYGMTAWDVSNLFVLVVPATLVPVAYYASYEEVGSKVTHFANQITHCALGSGESLNHKVIN